MDNARLLQAAWRGLFAAGGAAISVGGSMHPGGSMAEMLAHPDWFPSHALVSLGFACITAGLWLWGRERALPQRSGRWWRIALAATLVQTLDMLLHTSAMVDHAHLVAGEPTPVLATHLVMTAIVYPIFALCTIGFIVAAARDRVLGSRWIAWLGIVGAVGHGLAGPLVAIWDVGWARPLFPLIVLVALWYMLAACLPTLRVQRLQNV
jgi:hypothetical protein